jgi:CheY-like chemotaxis protein
MTGYSLVWIDDEMESLQSLTLFLTNKGYTVTTFSNGLDALEHIEKEQVDLVLLDESMPGLSGLQTLSRIKQIKPRLPVVLVTKNETENLMDEAIGSQIADYLIKPVHPNQVLLSIKKLLDNRRLVAEKTTQAYHQEFRKMMMQLEDGPDHAGWMDVYRQLVHWELEMEKSDSPEMEEVLKTQKKEANAAFAKYISKNYLNWIQPTSTSAPVMSHQLLPFKVLPHVEPGIPVFFVLIDNLRFDQWKAIEPLVTEYYRVLEEETFYSILPTATQYSRNAIMAGMLPSAIQKQFPQAWKNDDDEGGKNQYEPMFLEALLKRMKKEQLRYSYTKVLSLQEGQQLVQQVHNLMNNDLNVIVYNFVDMLSHARNEMEILKELVSDERSYRSITKSWFEHSPLFQALKKISEKKVRLIIATDHGSIQVGTACKVVGDRQTSTNIRYKHGRNLDFEAKDVVSFKKPTEAGLPEPNINSSYIFAKEDGYLCYPNNYNHFVNYYRNTFQHGGISMEEMIIPVIKLASK